jgi:DNA-binding XRE family transcriptional regulator
MVEANAYCLAVRMPYTLREVIDAWRHRQPDSLSQAEAARRLISKGLLTDEGVTGAPRLGCERMADRSAITSESITPEQCRAARAILDLTREELSAASGVAHTSIFDFETGRRGSLPRTVEALRRTLERCGVAFLVDEHGIKLRKPAS